MLANDALSFGFLRVAHQHGVRVPGDLSVVGFDGLPQGELLYRALTTMRQPMREMGRMACMRLFEEPARTPVRTELTMELVVRETTGPAAPQSVVRRELRLVPGADRPDALGV